MFGFGASSSPSLSLSNAADVAISPRPNNNDDGPFEEGKKENNEKEETDSQIGGPDLAAHKPSISAKDGHGEVGQIQMKEEEKNGEGEEDDERENGKKQHIANGLARNEQKGERGEVLNANEGSELKLFLGFKIINIFIVAR